MRQGSGARSAGWRASLNRLGRDLRSAWADPGLADGHGDAFVGARHRREHRGLQCGRRHPRTGAAVRRCRTSRANPLDAHHAGARQSARRRANGCREPGRRRCVPSRRWPATPGDRLISPAGVAASDSTAWPPTPEFFDVFGARQQIIGRAFTCLAIGNLREPVQRTDSFVDSGVRCDCQRDRFSTNTESWTMPANTVRVTMTIRSYTAVDRWELVGIDPAAGCKTPAGANRSTGKSRSSRSSASRSGTRSSYAPGSTISVRIPFHGRRNDRRMKARRGRKTIQHIEAHRIGSARSIEPLTAAKLPH
jgi:hypothetical protein